MCFWRLALFLPEIYHGHDDKRTVGLCPWLYLVDAQREFTLHLLLRADLILYRPVLESRILFKCWLCEIMTIHSWLPDVRQNVKHQSWIKLVLECIAICRFNRSIYNLSTLPSYKSEAFLKSWFNDWRHLSVNVFKNSSVRLNLYRDFTEKSITKISVKSSFFSCLWIFFWPYFRLSKTVPFTQSNVTLVVAQLDRVDELHIFQLW